MPYDGVFAAAIVRELQTILIGARIDKIFQPTPDTVVLYCRQPGDTFKLVLSAHTRLARVHLTAGRAPNPLHAPVFCMTLRKHLDPGRIATIEQQGLDRIIKLGVEGFDDVGRPARRALIAELTGRNSNIVLVDESSGRVVDALRRVNSRTNLYRALLPGETYVPPPKGNKIDPRPLSVAKLQICIEAALKRDSSAPSDPDAVAAALTAAFDGMSPFAAREVLLRAGLEGGSGTEAAARALFGILQDLDRGQTASVLRLDDRGEPRDLWDFIPEQWRNEPLKTLERANDAADVYYTHHLTRQSVADKRRVLQRGIDAARKRLLRKAKALEGDLQDAARANQFRIFGELLTANMHLVSRGRAADVPNYYANGQSVSIPLDPKIGPAANAQRYFKRYSKLQTAATVVRAQLDRTIADIDWLDQAAVHLQMVEVPEQLDEIARELLASDTMPRNVKSALQGEETTQGRRHHQKTKEQMPSAPLAALIGSGARVLIGRSGRQNDRISLRLARPDDVWLHVKDGAGAHVLLPRDQFAADTGDDPPPELIAAAAALAAYFSKSRHSANVAVDWTLAKHVRKPKGARPGMVIYDHHRTVYATPDEELVSRQLSRAGQ